MEPTQDKYLELTNLDCLQIFTCYQGLKVAAESDGKMHLTNPRLVRNAATHWLGRVGIKAGPRTPWKTLYWNFASAFGEVIKR
jgi:hypothetical protein